MQIPWWGYVILAGLSWGTYVPLIFFGGGELNAKPGAMGGRLMAIVCVGVAYLVLAIAIPVVVFLMNQSAWQEVNKGSSSTSGYVFAGLAGVMGAVGAICVVFASSEAMTAGRAEFLATAEGAEYKEKLDALQAESKAAADGSEEKQEIAAKVAALNAEASPRIAKYRILIAPLIFSIAPIINTLLASLWDPKSGKWANFGWNPPHWLFWVGILLVAAGTGCVLLAKEFGEQDRQKKHAAMKAPAAPPLDKVV